MKKLYQPYYTDKLTIEECCKLLKEHYIEYYTPIIKDIGVQKLSFFLNYDVISSEIKKKTYQYYVIYDNNNEIGVLKTKTSKDYLQISEIFIQKEFRQKGFLKFVLKELVKNAHKKNIKKIKICPEENNQLLKTIFEKLNFKKEENIALYIGDDIYIYQTKYILDI